MTDDAFTRTPLPRLCNLDRLRHAMAARSLDGIVATLPLNVFYLTSFNGVAHKADEPRPYGLRGGWLCGTAVVWRLTRLRPQALPLACCDHSSKKSPAEAAKRC